MLFKAIGRAYVRQEEIAALLRTICNRAQVETRLTPHGLRATFITLALNDGVALRDVQDAARHADPRTPRLYDRDADEHSPTNMSDRPGPLISAASAGHPRRCLLDSLCRCGRPQGRYARDQV